MLLSPLSGPIADEILGCLETCSGVRKLRRGVESNPAALGASVHHHCSSKMTQFSGEQYCLLLCSDGSLCWRSLALTACHVGLTAEGQE